jgi:hypothetical protein
VDRTDGIVTLADASGTETLNLSKSHPQALRIIPRRLFLDLAKPWKRKRNNTTTMTPTHRVLPHPQARSLAVAAGSAIARTRKRIQPTSHLQQTVVAQRAQISRRMVQARHGRSASKIPAKRLMPVKEASQLVTVPVCARRKWQIRKIISIVGLLELPVGQRERKGSGGSVMRLIWG